MYISTEETPNPNTLKFNPGQIVYGEDSITFDTPTAAEASPLATALFALDDVTGVFFGSDFISVTQSGTEWINLKPQVLGAIMDHFTSGAPLIIADMAQDGVEGFDDDPQDAPIIAQIKDLLETKVRPAVARDGGDITYHGFREGTVYLHMQGACAGCPSSTITLKNGIENLLRHYVPEVSGVEAI
ncbi:MAG: NifU family protein [Pseudomonadota bacterium]